MNGNSFLIDTNIILYILNGNKELAKKIDNKNIYISFVTELELLGYKGINKNDSKIIKSFIKECTVIDINKTIKKNTIKIKQKYSVKLPDAIIGATSQFLNLPLITADKGFEKLDDFNLVLVDI